MGTYTEFNLGGDVGLSIGAHVSLSYITGSEGNSFVIGVGASVGLGFSITLLDVNIQRGIVDDDGNPFN